MAETIGSLADKISIAGLKIYHMEEQLHRSDADPGHAEACRRRVEILRQQRDDLAKEFSELLETVFSGKKKMKVYRQFKMYNDPAYRAGQKG